jgi:hypothetical protein
LSILSLTLRGQKSIQLLAEFWSDGGWFSKEALRTNGRSESELGSESAM